MNSTYWLAAHLVRVFSTLRTRKKSNAVADDRNDLLFEFLRIVEAISPRSIMMENVPALAQDKRMKVFLKRISVLGYKVGRKNIRVEDAAEYGVPQRRYRMILLASKTGQVKQAEKSETITVRKCLDAVRLAPVGEAGDPLHDHVPNRAAHMWLRLSAIYPRTGDQEHRCLNILYLIAINATILAFVMSMDECLGDKVSPTITGGCGNPSKGTIPASGRRSCN